MILILFYHMAWFLYSKQAHFFCGWAIHFVTPHGKLFQRLLALEQLLGSIPPLLTSQQYAGPREPHYGIPPEEWPNVVRRVIEHQESLRQIAADYGVSHETIRRVLRTSRNHRAG